MIGRVLVLLGPLTVVAGIWRGSSGLVAVGGLWFLLAFAILRNSYRLKAAVDERKKLKESTGTEPPGPIVSMSSFLLSTATLLLAGVPAIVVGAGRIGIADADADWRWLPLVGGIVITGIALLSALLFLLATGITTAVGPPPTIPAEIVIVSMKQTGTYINEMPRIEFVLDVTPETGAPYQVTKKATVPFTAIGSLAPGKGFKAKVAGAEEPTSMEIDWDSPLQDPSADSLDDRLRRLDDLKAQGLVTDAEYDTQRQRLLDSL